MTDVELEIIYLATGENLGIYPLTLCNPGTFELDVGSYRFIATYPETGEVLQVDIDIGEGVNSPLDIEFEPPPLELCYWIDSKGGPTGLTVPDIYEIGDAYVLNTPPSGYTFIPTVVNVYGVADYYLGFDADAKTGCDYF